MIPQGWKEKQITDVVAALEAGASVNGEDRPKKAGEVGVLKVSAVTYGRFNPYESKVVTHPSEKERLSVIPTQGSIIISRANTLGLVGATVYVRKDYPDLFLSDKLWKLTPAETYSAEWLSQLLTTKTVRSHISNRATGTSGSMKNISQEAFLSIHILAPPLAEQRKIAAILGTWDAAIATTARLIAALRERKRALMQRLLTGEVRFPGFVQSTETRKTRFGQIPFDWKEGSIEDLGCVNAENADTNSEKEWYYIDLSMVDNGKIDLPTERIQYKKLPSRAQRILHRNDVIMSTVRPNLHGYARIDFEPVDVLCSTGFAIISPHVVCDTAFIYQSLYSPTIQQQIGNLVAGSNYPAINSSEVRKLNIPIPHSDERYKIGEVLQGIDRQIYIYTNYRDKLMIQKRGLMQRLLTGQVRVQPDED